MKKSKKYLKEVIEVAKTITPEVLDKFCDELIKLRDDFTAQDIARITECINQPSARVKLLKLLSPVEMHDQEIAPPELSWALKTACLFEELKNSEENLELVWTGPSLASSALRRTDQVLYDLIGQAKESILLVTFAAYKIPSISKALSEAAKRNVKIILILESSEESEGKLTFDAITALGKEVERQSKVFIWPHSERKQDDKGHYGSLHAKCAVVDSKTAFISSANLTEYAMLLNMELGIVVKGGNLPGKIQEHFNYLISAKVLKKI